MIFCDVVEFSALDFVEAFGLGFALSLLLLLIPFVFRVVRSATSVGADISGS